MKGFWTCGPFKEIHERIERMSFRAEQMKVFMDILEEDKINQKLLLSGSLDEQAVAAMVQIDIDKKIAILLGIPDGYEKKNDEISRKTLLELIRKGTEE